MPRIQCCCRQDGHRIIPTVFTVGKRFRTNAGMQCARDRLMKEFGASLGAREGRTEGTYFAVFPIDDVTLSLQIPYNTPNLKAVLLSVIATMNLCNSRSV